MAIFVIESDKLTSIQETTFENVGLKEREDLQKLIRNQIEVISPDLLILSEEFGDWDNSRRRIDLLALDKDANLVVIEIKRTEDGGHMELQAIRYASMVDNMTFQQAVDARESYLKKIEITIDAKESILEFLQWQEPDESQFAQDVRILLVSADFSKELTNAVMWLNNSGLDIKCIRIKPYKENDRILIDIQQVIPLPEAEEYMINIREKIGRERLDRTEGNERFLLRKQFWTDLLNRAKLQSDLFANISPSTDSLLSTGSGISSFVYCFEIRKYDSGVRFLLVSDLEKNKAAFDSLYDNKDEIERMFGEQMDWERRDDIKKSQLGILLQNGGYRSDRSEWPMIQDAMIKRMIKLNKAIDPFIDSLRA